MQPGMRAPLARHARSPLASCSIPLRARGFRCSPSAGTHRREELQRGRGGAHAARQLRAARRAHAHLRGTVRAPKEEREGQRRTHKRRTNTAHKHGGDGGDGRRWWQGHGGDGRAGAHAQLVRPRRQRQRRPGEALRVMFLFRSEQSLPRRHSRARLSVCSPRKVARWRALGVPPAGRCRRAAASRCPPPGGGIQLVRGRDEACPVSTRRGTRLVQLVREGRGGGGGTSRWCAGWQRSR